MTKSQINKLISVISALMLITIIGLVNNLNKADHREQVLKEFIKSNVDMNKVLQKADSTNVDAIVIVNEY
jgi:hypothetical protein